MLRLIERLAKDGHNVYFIHSIIHSFIHSITGYANKIDKKSMLRLIERLAKDGHIKSIKTILKLGETSKQLHFVCEPNLSAKDSFVKSAIEQVCVLVFVMCMCCVVYVLCLCSFINLLHLLNPGRSRALYLFIHSFIHPFIHSVNHSFI